MQKYRSLVAVCAGVVCGLSAYGKTTDLLESARAIPVSQEADVVVVGGSCGAVAAAQAAAKAGAKVFLVASRPYVGDDLAGALRLWLEAGETPTSPLARALFVQTSDALPFTYSSSVPAAARHEDTGSMLNDGVYQDVVSQSVEFSGDVTFSLALNAEKNCGR